MSKTKSFQVLTAHQWLFLWSAYWRLWPTLLRIKLKQSAWLKQKITLGSRVAELSQPRLPLAEAMFESVRLAARLHFMSAHCLPRSIVLADMLVAKGYAAQVIIGVSRNHQGLASHAWVELNGVLVGEPETVAQDFTSLNDL